MEKRLLKKGDRVRVTLGARKGDEGLITEIRDGVKYSIQVRFIDQPSDTVPIPYAPSELEFVPVYLDRDDDEFPAKGCVGFMTVCVVFVLALFYCCMVKCSESQHIETRAVPLSDTVARIPNYVDSL